MAALWEMLMSIGKSERVARHSLAAGTHTIVTCPPLAKVRVLKITASAGSSDTHQWYFGTTSNRLVTHQPIGVSPFADDFRNVNATGELGEALIFINGATSHVTVYYELIQDNG